MSAEYRKGVLDRAAIAVCKDRAATHGKPEDTFGQIAAVWSARVGVKITPAQACVMLADLKGARAWFNPDHLDNWDDGAGYFACGADCARADRDDEALRTAFRQHMEIASGTSAAPQGYHVNLDALLTQKAADASVLSVMSPEEEAIPAEDSFPRSASMTLRPSKGR